MQSLGRDVVLKENALTEKECHFLINKFNDNPDDVVFQSRATTNYGGNTKFHDYPLKIAGDRELQEFLLGKLSSAIDEYKEHLGLEIPHGTVFERFEVMCLKKNEGTFDPHCDANSSDHKRTLAVIWYLCDVKEGGQLIVPSKENPLEVSPKQGRMVIMPAYWTHYHYITPPISDDRYSMITFVRYK